MHLSITVLLSIALVLFVGCNAQIVNESTNTPQSCELQDEILIALDKAGIEYPSRRFLCEHCMGICGESIPKACASTCEEQYCVRYLGDYTGDE